MIPVFNLRRIASSVRSVQNQERRRRSRPTMRVQPLIGTYEEGGRDWSVTLRLIQGFGWLNELWHGIWEYSPWAGQDIRYSGISQGNYSVELFFSHKQMVGVWDRIIWAQKMGYIDEEDIDQSWDEDFQPLQIWSWMLDWNAYMPKEFVVEQHKRYAEVVEEEGEDMGYHGDQLLYVTMTVQQLEKGFPAVI